jgi:signal peptidase I
VLRAVRGFGQLIGVVPPDGLVLVKRVIAIGGQTVKGVDGKVMVSKTGPNGPWVTLDEPYVFNGSDQNPKVNDVDSHANFGPVTVPKNRLWVMGDHRSDSADSRYHCSAAGDTNTFGSTCDPTSSTVPVGDVIGKAFVVAWPPSHWRTLGTPSTFKPLAQGLPLAGGVLLTAPVLLIRRRRRRRGAA